MTRASRSPNPRAASPQSEPLATDVAAWTTVLVLLTVAGMGLAASTKLALVNDYVFATPIVGVLVYGVLLSAGHFIAERSLQRRNDRRALAGTVLLLGTYSMFGAGILRETTVVERGQVLLVTLSLTALVCGALTACVYRCPNRSFERCRSVSGGLFLIGLLVALLASLWSPLVTVAFLCFLGGFLTMFPAEVADVRDQRHTRAITAAIGVYVAFVGVFVHILQLVAYDH